MKEKSFMVRSSYLSNISTMFKEKRDIYLSILFGFIAGMSTIGLMAASGYLISIAALEPPLYILITIVAVVKFGSICRAITRYLERYYSHRATFTMLSHVRVYFYNKLEKLNPRIYHSYRSGDLLARMVGDVESLQHFFLRVLYPPLIMGLVFISTIIFVSFFSIQFLFLISIGFLLTGIVIPVMFAQIQRKTAAKTGQKRAFLSTEVTEYYYGYRELKLHQQLHEKERALTEASYSYVEEQVSANQQANLYQSIQFGLSLFLTWTILGVGAYYVAIGELAGIYLAMFIMISLTLFEFTTPMATFPIYHEESRRAADRILSVIQKAPEQEQEYKERIREAQPPSIQFHNVSFTYPGEERKIIDNLSLSIPAGSTTAIVGPSGSGKSTLLQLILQLYPVDQGEMLINSKALNSIQPQHIWENANVVLQDNHFFYGTIKDNLLISDPSWQDEELQDILNHVQLSSFSLDDPVLEKGHNLSGGEKQRIALARAILKGATLWLLDEPTSALDAWTEKKVVHSLLEHAQQDSLILVSHKLEGLEGMDQIIVMNQGRVVEQGSYEQLINQRGYFYQLKQIENEVIH